MEFLYARDKRVQELMPDMHRKVVQASRDILSVDRRPYIRDHNFHVSVCPVRVKQGDEFVHPILLTACEWDGSIQMLYWPMDMIPLITDDEGRQVEDFVKDDKVYYNRIVSPGL
ncbi:MAG: hypothetical protein XD87_0120 [candidate division WS6 bacterium 36_33]|uniref:Uncharacterized protein n=1 Tax=candidate division WS6 bacterium 36_33 TaxID=1641388 RepID=A0A101GZA2_9BACT|nr:MAG: hypothetical protein XD87_0120 [candidate division WS6 bacterium 36_33]